MPQIRDLIYIIEDDQIMAECIARAATMVVSDHSHRNEPDPLHRNESNPLRCGVSDTPPAQLTATSSANSSLSPLVNLAAAPLANPSSHPSVEPTDGLSARTLASRPASTPTTYQPNGALGDQSDAIPTKLSASRREIPSSTENSAENDQQSFYTNEQQSDTTDKPSKTDQQSFFNKISEITPVKNYYKTDQRSFSNKKPLTNAKDHLDQTDQWSFSSNNIRIFNDAISAMDAISGELPALILLDVLLSGPNGFTLLNELASYSDTADIPIIIISSLDLRQRDLEIYGVVNILNKSTMTPHTIQEAIRHAL